MTQSTAMEDILKRTYLTTPFDIFLSAFISQYDSIGEITSYEPITEGYESANIFLQTSKGKYVLKIFESIRSKTNIDQLVRILVEAPKVGVPVPRLIEGTSGFLSTFKDSDHEVYYYLTEFFEGESYDKKTPSIEVMLEIGQMVAKLNQLTFPVQDEYDPWGNKNLVNEFELNKDSLSEDVKKHIMPVVRGMKELDMSTFSKSVIHGDMQRKHVLKNKENKYCILDFGCARYDYKVYDLSTYLAWFCLSQETFAMKDEIFEKVIESYTEIHKLSEAELKSIPVLINAAYASYFLKTSLLIQDGDQSLETIKWHQDAEEMLVLTNAGS